MVHFINSRELYSNMFQYNIMMLLLNILMHMATRKFCFIEYIVIHYTINFIELGVETGSGHGHWSIPKILRHYHWRLTLLKSRYVTACAITWPI